MQTEWNRLPAGQRTFLNNFWSQTDVELDGDTAIQQTVRFLLFHILQAGAYLGRAIAATGLTEPGYDGHTFWETKTFVLRC
ncbi:hypothetical protein [Cryobacterium sp. Y11]|uniref:hypothetical protein n=1 Tax=Cryobacterium sp. Y11 TaxID=2045016 RepID=UPI0018EA53C5